MRVRIIFKFIISRWHNSGSMSCQLLVYCLGSTNPSFLQKTYMCRTFKLRKISILSIIKVDKYSTLWLYIYSITLAPLNSAFVNSATAISSLTYIITVKGMFIITFP